MGDWTKFATAFYREKKLKDPSYKFKQALQDASSVYKKGGSGDIGKMEGAGDMSKMEGAGYVKGGKSR